MSDAATAARLSLGLPTYNGEQFLAAAVESLLAQTYTDFELLISDNGSDDATGEIAQRFADRDPRVRYVRHPVNRGSAFNHNYLIEHARGEFFKWVSDDDLYAPDLLQRCMDALDARPEISLAHAWTAFIDDRGQITHRVDYPLTTDVRDPVTRFRSILYTQGGDDTYGIIRMSVLKTVAPFGSYHWADRTFVAELALNGPFHNVPDFLYFRRDHPNRTTRVGSNDIRTRCTRLDPARANRWRHPVVRLLGEYILGFISAIRRAPLTPGERLRCGRELAIWVLRHLDPSYRSRMADSPDPALRRGGTSADPDGSGGQPAAAAEQPPRTPAKEATTS
jgi:glycosyltransferase involved in cell wall biosynthesis